jgi:hypothetical protein
MSINGFHSKSIDSLKTQRVGAVEVPFAGHHAIGQNAFDGDPLFNELKNFGFDGQDWRHNGVPLPRS